MVLAEINSTNRIKELDFIKAFGMLWVVAVWHQTSYTTLDVYNQFTDYFTKVCIIKSIIE